MQKVNVDALNDRKSIEIAGTSSCVKLFSYSYVQERHPLSIKRGEQHSFAAVNS